MAGADDQLRQFEATLWHVTAEADRLTVIPGMAVREVAGEGWFVDPQDASANDPTASTDEHSLALGVDERLLTRVGRDGLLFTAALPILTIEEQRERIERREERLVPVSGWPIGRIAVIGLAESPDLTLTSIETYPNGYGSGELYASDASHGIRRDEPQAVRLVRLKDLGKLYLESAHPDGLVSSFRLEYIAPTNALNVQRLGPPSRPMVRH
jgi:hypothetical protein